MTQINVIEGFAKWKERLMIISELIIYYLYLILKDTLWITDEIYM